MDLDELARLLDNAAKQIEPSATLPLSPQAVKTIKILLSADIKKNFAGSHDPEGNPWPPLKRPRRNSKGADKPLLDWGVGMQSAAAVGHEQDVATIEAIARGVRVSFDQTDKIRFHDGTVKGDWMRLGTRRGIPPREFLGVSAECAEQIAEVVAEDRTRQVMA